MLVNADFHVHSCFSMASSKDMLIKNMAPKSKLKGLQLLGTGDAFHPGWLNIIEESTTYKGDGIYTADDMDFVLTTEVEGKNRIHHLIIIPDIGIARELSEKLVSKNKESDGRPRIRYSGAELLEMVKEYDCLIGPAHAFTPWTGMYKSFDSIYDCYDKAPDFVELGLSADTFMADTVAELKNFPFLTNSDAHSPWPHRLGREFNQIELEDMSYSSIKKSIKNKDIKANYGLVPNLGKYHMTACTKCYKLVDPLIAKENKMKCDIFEKDNKVFIEMDVPGYDKKDIKVECNKGNIVVKAEHHEKHEDNKKYLHRERKMYGRLERSFHLEDIDEKTMEAEFKDGILTISVSKVDEDKNKRYIEVK